METSAVKEIYRQTCETKGYPPSEGQFKTWKTQFSLSSENDLRGAIDEWFARNATFPMPSDLLPAVQRIAQSRHSQYSTPRSLVTWKCHVCGYTMAALLTGSDSTWRNCSSFYGPVGSRSTLPRGQVCGGAMQIMVDERGAA